jgi:arsenate reductase (thioredoxin)
MAERLFRDAVGDRHEARSAGVSPGHAPEPTVLEALREVGVDASDHVPTKLEDDAVEWADVVVATCDVACPVVTGKRYENWNMPDPYGRPLDDVREIRDRIAERVDALVRELG